MSSITPHQQTFNYLNIKIVILYKTEIIPHSSVTPSITFQVIPHLFKPSIL
jgi:hypothetical protein